MYWPNDLCHMVHYVTWFTVHCSWTLASINACMMLRYFIACLKYRLLTWHNQETAQWSQDPFPCERVGVGHETRQCCGTTLSTSVNLKLWKHRVALELCIVISINFVQLLRRYFEISLLNLVVSKNENNGTLLPHVLCLAVSFEAFGQLYESCWS